MASTLPKLSDHGSSRQSETPPQERSKYVVRGKDALIGYWKYSSEPHVINKHAMYGVIQANGVFRVKVVPETRNGTYLKEGNYPKQSGGCWVSYDSCVLEKYLENLSRMEVKEYCRICVADPQYNDGCQGPPIVSAVKKAKERVAKMAAVMGLNTIQYNEKRCDELDRGAVFREARRQKRNGEVVASEKVEDAKEATERETMNSKGDADMAEAIRQSSTEQKAVEAPLSPNQNSDASPSTPGDVNNSDSMPRPDGGSMNDAVPENVKFYLLDRDTQRAKMEKWCRQKPTSQYHNLDGEGQRRHVEKHIDQLIARQTGAATRPKKRSRTGDLSATPAADVRSSSYTESPGAHQKVLTHRKYLTLQSVLNEPITPTQSEYGATQPKPVEISADVPMGDATVETTAAPVQAVISNSTPPALSSATPVATSLNADSDAFEIHGLVQPEQNLWAQFVSQTQHSGPKNPCIPTEGSQGFMSAPSAPYCPYVTPYPTPPTRKPVPSTAPQIFSGRDGVKYSVDPSSKFGDLLVSVDSVLVEINDLEYTRQFVLLAKTEPRPWTARGKQMMLGEEVFKMAEEGVFRGYAVGVERRVTRLGGEEYVKLAVLVPFRWSGGV